VDLAVLLWIASKTGWELALGLVIVPAVVGAWLIRREGLRCWRAVDRDIAQGQIPADPLLDGLLVLVAGALMITPGVLTDTVGIALLIPPVRRLVKRWLVRWIRARLIVTRVGERWSSPSRDDGVIDVEHRPPEEGEKESEG